MRKIKLAKKSLTHPERLKRTEYYKKRIIQRTKMSSGKMKHMRAEIQNSVGKWRVEIKEVFQKIKQTVS